MSAYVCVGEKSTLKNHLRWPFLKMLIAASLGGCLVGLNNVFLNYLLPLVKADFGLGKNKNFEAVMVIIGYLAKAIGVVIAICTMDSFGRRKTIYWAAVILAFGAGLTLVFPCIQTMMIGRFIIMAAAGAVDITTPVYIAELTPNRVRGMVMTFQLVPAAIGQVLGHCVRDILKKAHLDFDLDMYKEAVDVVRRICPPQDAKDELYSLQSGIEEELDESISLVDDRNQTPFGKVYTTRRALLTWMLCISLPHLCGIDFLVWYTSTFTKATRISQEMSHLHRSIIACWLKMMGSAMGACFLDVYGISRKEVLRVCFVGVMAAHGAVSVLLHGETDLSFSYWSMVLEGFIFCLGSYYIGHAVAATITVERGLLRFLLVDSVVFVNWAICNHLIAEISVLIGMSFHLDAMFSALFIWDLILLGLVWRHLPKTSAMPLMLCWKKTLTDDAIEKQFETQLQVDYKETENLLKENLHHYRYRRLQAKSIVA